MGIEKIMQYECRVCGRRIDVSSTGDVIEEPVLCCGLEATEVSVQEPAELVVPTVRKKPARKKAAKKAVKKKAAKKAKKKAVKKKAAKKKATKKKAAKKKTAKKKAKKKTSKRR